MRKIKWPKIGQYVLVTKYRDKDPYDPWYVDCITEVLKTKDQIYYKVAGSGRLWKCCFKITLKEGQTWLQINRHHITNRST